jgi:SAM-dependent methyltransferase
MTPDGSALADLYANHPLSEETILARVLRGRGTLDGITELDLAQDSRTEITDQNHVGGVAAVVALALRAGVTPSSRVVDLGSGLGGSARCLAHLIGCRAHGIELTRRRCEEARRLTARVGLDHLVTFACGDALTAPLEPQAFDVIWGQGAWMHIEDVGALFRRAAAVAAAGGRVAFEEACLAGTARTDTERESLAGLERLWGGRFLALGAWRAALASASFDVRTVDDETDAFVEHFERLRAISRAHGAGLYPEPEVSAFTHAIALARSGIIRYVRVIATAST